MKSSEDQSQEAITWFCYNYNKDQEFYPSRVIAMDCEYLTISLYDLYRLSGKISSPNIKRISPMIEESLPDLPEDQWENLPVKMKIGNRISYALIISINLENNDNEYLVKKDHNPRLNHKLLGISTLVHGPGSIKEGCERSGVLLQIDLW